MSLFVVLLALQAAASATENFPRQSLPVSLQAPGMHSNPVGIYSTAGSVGALTTSSTELNRRQISSQNFPSASVPRQAAEAAPVLQRRSLMDLSRKIFGGTYVTLHVGDMPPNHPLVKYPAPLRQNPAQTTAATVRDQMTQAMESSPNFNYNRNMHHAHQKNNGEGSHYSKPRPQPNSLFKRFKLKPRPFNQFKQRPIPMPVPISFDSTEHNPTAMSELRPFEPSEQDTQIQASASAAAAYNHNRHYLGTPGPHVDPSANSFNQNTTNHHPIHLLQQHEAPAISNNHRRHALPPPGPSPQNSVLLNITFEGGPGRGTHYNKGHFNTNQMLRRKRLNMQQKFHMPPPFPSIKQNYSVVNSYGASDDLSRRVARKDSLIEDGSKTMYIFSSSESVEANKPRSGSFENGGAIKRSGQGSDEQTTIASAGFFKKPLLQKSRQLGPTYRRPTATTTTTTATTTGSSSTMTSRKREVPMEMSPMETTLLSTDWSRRSRSSEYYKRKATAPTTTAP